MHARRGQREKDQEQPRAGPHAYLSRIEYGTDGYASLFLDRSLGRKIVPGLLRAGGLRLVTLSEHYGVG